MEDLKTRFKYILMLDDKVISYKHRLINPNLNPKGDFSLFNCLNIFETIYKIINGQDRN